MTNEEIQESALNRARTGTAKTNYHAIFQGFAEKGIPCDQIKPRENIFTFQAWKALGRKVKKGEHGIKICTFMPCQKEQKNESGEIKIIYYSKPWISTVFHISQTESIGSQTGLL